MRRLGAPRLDLDADKLTAFEKALASTRGDRVGIEYQLPYPKHEFLSYLVAKHDVLLHGSGSGAIDVFEPTPQTDYFGRVRTAVFAASDGIWPMFFAILDRSRYHGSLQNACYWDIDAGGERQKCYAFSITREVTPLARLAVSPSDFPFLKNVEGHGDERTDRFEELVYELGTGAQELSTSATAIDLVLAMPSLWRERAAEFVALLPATLPDLRGEVLDDERALVLRIHGSRPSHDRLAVALRQWRRGISGA
jgi:hypothetical protein